MTTVEQPLRLAADLVSQVALSPDDPVKVSQQEGGRAIIAGTFCPRGTQVKIDIDLSASFMGWGAGGVDFHLGVIDTPTDPWEPGGKNRIVEANFAGRGPLPGVRPGSYEHYSVGFLTADTLTPHIARTIVLDDLEPGLTYDWELRCGGASFFKWFQFAEGSRPTTLAVSPDNLYVWALLSGTNRLALVQLGWAPLWSRSGYSSEMQCVAEIPLPGTAGGIAPQPLPIPAEAPQAVPRPGPGPRYVALVDQTHHELVIVDAELLVVDGTYALPGGAVPSGRRVLWDRFGDKIYIGGAEDGTLHRFDLASRTFDVSIVVDATPGADIVPLAVLRPAETEGATASSRYLWCSSVRNGLIAKVDLQELTAVEFHRYPDGVTAPTCGAARHTTGGLVVVESVDRVRCFDADGQSTSDWSAALEGAELRNASCSICLDDDEIRAFWSLDGGFGWAWIDGTHEIEPRPDGRDWILEVFPDLPRATREKRVINKSSLPTLFTTKDYGDVVNTALEGTLIALPDEDLVIQWPGGAIEVRPHSWFGGTVGTEHALVTFTGAESTGA